MEYKIKRFSSLKETLGITIAVSSIAFLIYESIRNKFKKTKKLEDIINGKSVEEFVKNNIPPQYEQLKKLSKNFPEIDDDSPRMYLESEEDIANFMIQHPGEIIDVISIDPLEIFYGYKEGSWYEGNPYRKTTWQNIKEEIRGEVFNGNIINSEENGDRKNLQLFKKLEREFNQIK